MTKAWSLRWSKARVKAVTGLVNGVRVDVRNEAARKHLPRAQLWSAQAESSTLLGVTDEWQSCGQVVRSDSAEGVTAQVEDGASAELTAAHPCPFQTLLNQVLGATFDGAAADRQALPTEQGILHPQRIRGEVAALAVQHLEGIVSQGDGFAQQYQQWHWAMPPQQMFG